MRFDKRESKKSKNGYTWRVTFDYTDKYGKRRRCSKSGFPTKKAAQIAGQSLLADLEAGIDIRTRDKTVDELFEEWKQINTLKPNTRSSYYSVYTAYISPKIGSVAVSKIGYIEMQTLFKSLSDKGISTVRAIKKVLGQLNKLAVKAGYSKGWDLEMVEISGKDDSRKQTDDFISKTDFEHLVYAVSHGKDAFKSQSCAVFLYLGYYLGLRLSEALALRWTDFSSDYSTVRIHAQVVRYGGLSVEESLKTETSKSILPVPEPLIDSLQEWKRNNHFEFVVPNNEGNPLCPSVLRNTLKKSASNIGLTFRPHMLRHTYVTNLILAGADPKTAAELARHSDPNTTLKIYTEITGQRKEEVIRAAFAPEKPDLKA